MTFNQQLFNFELFLSNKSILWNELLLNQRYLFALSKFVMKIWRIYCTDAVDNEPDIF